jgi:hypothetical protein
MSSSNDEVRASIKIACEIAIDKVLKELKEEYDAQIEEDDQKVIVKISKKQLKKV